MSKPNDGGPAFPFVSHGGVHEHQACLPGMTMRDYFAAKAMQALINDPNWNCESESQKLTTKVSYEMADAMLAERSKDHE